MQKIKIACTSGITVALETLYTYPGKLKKHSQLEIERLCDSIEKDGFLFPIAVGKVAGKNYVVDGECRLFALQELESRGYEIPEVPVFYVRSNEETIKRNILIGTSTNHCVTKYSLKQFLNDRNVLKELAFNEGTLIDFYESSDIEKFFETTKKIVNTDTNDYLKGMKGGLL